MIIFDDNANPNPEVQNQVETFLNNVRTLEVLKNSPIIIFQDGKNQSYYFKCNIISDIASSILDLNAKLDPSSVENFRANRELMIEHNTYKKMASDAREGREFNDIIVEYTELYNPNKPLKVWGGQHRVRAIQEAFQSEQVSRYHGFRIFVNLTKQQRTDIALVSNTNISVSNDLFDRLQEETLVGLQLREWCWNVGLLKSGIDFPDSGSSLEIITVKQARTFITNFYLGKRRGMDLSADKLDDNIYEPYLCESGAHLDPKYDSLIKQLDGELWVDINLINSGKAFASLNNAQFKAVVTSKKISNRKGYRNKALTESVISSWAYIAGLLQIDIDRLKRHYLVPKVTGKIPDPLNANEMAMYKHDSDDPTYRGLGTRSSLKDRQRMAQLFLASSLIEEKLITKDLMNKAVSCVVGLAALKKSYRS